MKVQTFLTVLTVVNSALLICSLSQPRPVAAEVAGVLRGRALEIVDDHGRVRSTISVLPADPAYKMPDGTTGFPETVLFRLINSKGQPNVKIESTDGGSAMGLVGEAGNALIQAKGAGASVTVHNKDGREQLIKP
jgi:stage V sporulation protein SpoVS